MSFLRKFPWVFVLIAYLVWAQMSGTSLDGIPGYVFIGLAIAVLFVEFFKSGDINTLAFLLDQVFAILAVAVSTWLMSHLYYVEGQAPSFYHWLGCAVVLGDAILSPLNSFRTALRNFGVGNSV